MRKRRSQMSPLNLLKGLRIKKNHQHHKLSIERTQMSIKRKIWFTVTVSRISLKPLLKFKTLQVSSLHKDLKKLVSLKRRRKRLRTRLRSIKSQKIHKHQRNLKLQVDLK